jgi:hypothetical protein
MKGELVDGALNMIIKVYSIKDFLEKYGACSPEVLLNYLFFHSPGLKPSPFRRTALARVRL